MSELEEWQGAVRGAAAALRRTGTAVGDDAARILEEGWAWQLERTAAVEAHAIQLHEQLVEATEALAQLRSEMAALISGVTLGMGARRDECDLSGGILSVLGGDGQTQIHATVTAARCYATVTLWSPESVESDKTGSWLPPSAGFIVRVATTVRRACPDVTYVVLLVGCAAHGQVGPVTVAHWDGARWLPLGETDV